MRPFYGTILLLILINATADNGCAADLQTPKGAIPSSYFGLHIHHLAYPMPTPWPNMPVPEWRLWDADVTWADLEPNKGQWRFDQLDRFVSLAEAHGTEILLPLGGSPRWASARPNTPSNYHPGFTAEPASIDEWRNYVKTVTSRYKGRIHAYEIWNEPNLKDYWSGTTEQMLMLTKEASQIIRIVDPHAIVVSPSATADFGIPWLADFLKKGGGQYVDVIGFHFYVNPHTLPPEEMVPLIEHVREVLAANGSANKPVWNTETGWLAPAKFDSQELAAAYLARSFILSWAAGIQRFYWYAWDNQFTAIITYNESTRAVTPAGNAYNTIEQWLVGANMEGCDLRPDHTWTCRLNRSGRKSWIVWNIERDQKFDVPRGWNAATVTRLLGEKRPLDGSSVNIGQVPVLLTAR